MDYSKNVKILYIIIFFHNLIPAYVIERLFWEQRGMTVLMVVVCEIVYAVTVVIVEIPTGILADKYGRKALLVLGAVLSTLEFIILLTAYNFWTFALVVFLTGIASACTSGALHALLYDSLLTVNKEKSFEKIVGRINSLDFIAALLAALSGSILAKFFGFELTYILSAGSMFIALFATIFLKEPPMKSIHDKKPYKIREYFSSSISFFKDHPKLVIFIIHAMAISACITYLDEFWQLYMNEIGFPVLFFGVYSAAISLSRIPGNLLAGYLMNILKGETIILVVLGITAIGFFMTAIFPGVIGITMMIIIFLAGGVVDPVVTGSLHHRGSSEIRATIGSIQSLIERGIVFIVGMGFGLISSRYSVVTGFIFLGAITGLFFFNYLKKIVKFRM